MRVVTDYLPDVSVDDLIPDWILDGVRSAVRAIPGYTLLTYVIGVDPLTDEAVSVTPADLIEAVLTYGPFGAAVGPVLQAIEVLGEIFTDVSDQLAANGLTLARVTADIAAAWDELSVTNGIDGNVAIVSRYVDAFLRDVRDFVGATSSTQVLELVRAVVVDFAEPLLKSPEIAPVWNLAKKVLHYDPLRGVEVNAPTVEIIADFLRAHRPRAAPGADARSGARCNRRPTGSTLRSATFLGLISELGSLFSEAWAAIQPAEPAQPARRTSPALAQRAFGLVQRVADFAATVIVKILELIKNALLGWLSEHAHTVPGFHLLTVILGQQPVHRRRGPAQRGEPHQGLHHPAAQRRGDVRPARRSPASSASAAERIEGAMARLGISLEMITGDSSAGYGTRCRSTTCSIRSRAFVRVLALFGEPLVAAHRVRRRGARGRHRADPAADELPERPAGQHHRQRHAGHRGHQA